PVLAIRRRSRRVSNENFQCYASNSVWLRSSLPNPLQVLANFGNGAPANPLLRAYWLFCSAFGALEASAGFALAAATSFWPSAGLASAVVEAGLAGFSAQRSWNSALALLRRSALARSAFFRRYL